MGIEIERKFLVTGDGWRNGARTVRCKQGYLAVGPPVSVRVRIMDGEAMLNIKQSTLNISRAEYEYSIPVAEAEELLASIDQNTVVEKTRSFVAYGGKTWEVDEFLGANAGLIVAEIELDDRDEAFDRPPWLGEEVSGDGRYLNSSLSRRPFTTW
ncbi:MAG: CYTH domain-containing protein [Candidatus Hydrogenedentota bacterium]